MPSIAILSDSHLSIGNTDGDRNWEAALEHLDRHRPDLIIHAGDLSAGGHSSLADLAHARAQLDRLPAPVLVAPGNHDVGRPDPDLAVTLERRARYEQVVGPRLSTVELGGWRIVGLDSQALVSEHPGDEAEWVRVAEELTTDRPTVIVLHRPIGPSTIDEPDCPYRYLGEPHRSRFRELLVGAGTVEAVVSGHVHQWRSTELDGIVQLWAPSTWATIPARTQPTIGTKAVGLVELDLDATGTVGRARLVTPDGMVDRQADVDRPKATH